MFCWSDMNCTPTIGIDFKLRTIELDNKKIKLQLLDTAGQERFKTITTAHYRNAMGILLVYDITNEQSFKNIEEWLKNIEKHTSQPVNKILIGRAFCYCPCRGRIYTCRVTRCMQETRRIWGRSAKLAPKTERNWQVRTGGGI